MPLDRNQIADQLRRGITAGQYPPGRKLPSYRQLAHDLGAAPNTVGEAVRMLAAEGIVATKDKSGTVVLDPGDRAPADERIAAAREELLTVRTGLNETRNALAAIEVQVTDALDKLRD